MLLELHISPSNVHYNPNGEKICGSHWHIYTEEYGRNYAFPAEDVQEDAFVDNTIAFLTKFNVVEQPNINYQLEGYRNEGRKSILDIQKLIDDYATWLKQEITFEKVGEYYEIYNSLFG